MNRQCFGVKKKKNPKKQWVFFSHYLKSIFFFENLFLKNSNFENFEKFIIFFLLYWK